MSEKPFTLPTQLSRRLSIAFFSLLGLLITGTGGYKMLENLSWVDALYMTVITISTVGFGEVRELSAYGRLFTIALIIGGGGVAAFSLGTLSEYVISGEWRAFWSARKGRKMLEKLEDHVIVCGFGRVGRHVADELAAEQVPFIVIDTDPDRIAHVQKHKYLGMIGNAANESLLEQVGIVRARALVATVNSDAENVFIALTARSLRPDIYIVARANYEDSEPKLLRAGANRTILPYLIGGKRMVTTIMRPNVADFLDEVAHAGGMEFLLEQIEILDSSPLHNQTLQETEISSRLGITILACRTPDGKFLTPPRPNTVLESGMTMIALGTREQLRELMKLAKQSRPPAKRVA